MHAEESFIEPNLRFAAIDGSKSDVTIQIYFEHESRPPWDPSRFGFSDTPVAAIDLQLTAAALRQAAMDLRSVSNCSASQSASAGKPRS